MSVRYVGKVSQVRDEFTVVINMGSEKGVVEGDKFLIIGLGEEIVDPDTQEALEQLEIVRGKASVINVQNKISTLKSYEYEKSSDVKEITKVTGGYGMSGILGQNTVTESIKPGTSYLKELEGVQVGDCVIKL
ncbi:hypothetical protein [Methylobacter tundripaludum]|uniref:Uncharacterized protein n=1 Tax=Methylobacter tundripaludum (strain ATCC BAA-1195 / DSM 17260 / SV96) TaxID=697282 RepID=G3IX56_METTV|nr:hypothetical protein [Methylobacter tundripaludum]EGW21993.1 hypothetical protein Mettu_0788 [Methylobacter tundripaludum SV96]